MDPHTAFNFHLGHASPQVGVPEPAGSPPQSVPGRRTPLGAVGLGGFYSQSGHSSGSGMHHPNTDENRPSASSGRWVYHYINKFILFIKQKLYFRSSGHQSGQQLISGGSGKKSRQGKTVRLNINAR